MKPGDFVALSEFEGFASLYSQIGVVTRDTRVTHQMQSGDRGLVIAIGYDDATGEECMVMVSLHDGRIRHGWRPSSSFKVLQ